MMYPCELNHDQAVLDQIRFIDWQYDGSESPSQDDLAILGENVLLDCIDKSSVNIGDDVNVKFAVYRRGRKEVLPPLKGQVFDCFGPGDDFELTATVSCRSNFEEDRLEDGSRQLIKIEDVAIYSGSDFGKLWAVWRSWMGVGDEVRLALSDRKNMLERMKAEKEEPNG